jgi:putative addiction module component (TIGR02574 family)
MSKAEILAEVDDVLTDEDLILIDQRLAEHEADSQSAISWEAFKTQLEQRLGR